MVLQRESLQNLEGLHTLHKERKMKITLAQLKAKKACQSQLDLFEKYFGESVELTKNIWNKYRSHFDIYWVGNKLLTKKERATYESIRDPAWATYKSIRDQAWATYESIFDPALATYESIRDPALATYKSIRDQAVFDILNVRSGK